MSSNLVRGTPRSLGYRMPAEWEPQSATWLIWPQIADDWPGCFDEVRREIAELAAQLSRHQSVRILVNEPATREDVRTAIESAGGSADAVACHVIVTDDCWLRDCGPIFVTGEGTDGGRTSLVGWRFNAWGRKYPAWDNDARVPQRVAQLLNLPLFEPGMVLEGGAIDVNGRGTLTTTEQCLLNRNRNPQLTRSEIETMLRDFLGVSHIIWLGEGIAGDDTDGHVDDVARFVSDNTVVAAVEDDPADVNYKPLRDNVDRLRCASDQHGRPLRVATVPMPDPVVHGGRRLPASYANFVIANRCVIVPQFGCAQDAAAMNVLRDIFPDRGVVGIRATTLVRGCGAFHCITMHEPARG